MNPRPDKNHSVVMLILFVSIVIVVVATWYKFFLKKDYYFIAETACDPTQKTCFQRDCSNPDDCPPNGLDVYSVYKLRASDFGSCSADACPECTNGTIQCEELVCSPDNGDECS